MSVLGPTVHLLDAHTVPESEILRSWVAERETGAETVDLPDPHGGAAGRDRLFARLLERDDDPVLSPLRVVWFAPEHDGVRRARLRDVVLGDPRRPSDRRQERLRRNAPERYDVVVAEPASLSSLRTRYAASAGPSAGATGFAEFVARQAVLSLERAEYRLVGAHHKVPRLVREEILASARFEEGVTQLAADLNRPVDEVRAEAIADLDEMAAGYSRLLLDSMSRLGDFMCRPGYGDEIDYDPAQLDMVREVFQHHPVIVLPSHKSQMDGVVIPRALRDIGVPPTHIFAGINMSFGPLAPILRRMGRIFIRRTMKEDPVYRWVLREYMSYLLEKRFHLEWYIEGTRSRTGKLMPPKVGLLRYVVDAFLEGRSDDVMLLPVSIMYDQLHEIVDYSSEARGGKKQAEGIGWAIDYYRAQRRGYGRIYLRFGEPLSLRQGLGDYRDLAEPEQRLRLQKLAFEVCWRINHVTPITGSALLSLVLLSTRGSALTADELHQAVAPSLDQARRRGLPLAASAVRLDTVEGVGDLLRSLAANGTVERFDGGPEPVHRIAPGKELSAAFYRNTAIHYFVGGAIGELALIHAAESERNRLDAFWDEVFGLRDLLKFDFFFAEKEGFRKLVAEQLSGRLPDWEDRLAASVDPYDLLGLLQPLQSFAVLRPFVEAYGIVARVLARSPADDAVDEKACLDAALGLGTQLAMQGTVRTDEAVSKVLFRTGYELAAHRGLTRSGADVAEERAAFSAELVDVSRRIDITEQLTYVAAERTITVVGR